MASRPVFVPIHRAPYVEVYMSEFTWNGGFALSQKQKNIIALHEAFRRLFPEYQVLEISSKSLQETGARLSAFCLPKYVPSLGRSVPLECVFQGGKVFAVGGPYTDLYTATPRDAKRDPRLRESGGLKSFFFEGATFPLVPTTAFYDWLYINALLENKELSEKILAYDAFTDIEFHPEKSRNCQARAAAVFASLARAGQLHRCRDLDSFIGLM